MRGPAANELVLGLYICLWYCLSISLTLLLTAAAYKLTVSSMTPCVAYMTALDRCTHGTHPVHAAHPAHSFPTVSWL